VLNMIGAALWAPLVAGAGYLFGHTLSWLFTDLGRYEEVALLGLVALVAVVALIRRLVLRRRQRAP